MLTGTELMNELVDELNELKLSTMAATLDDLYHRPGFLEMDRLTMIAELIAPQFQEKVNTTLKNRLTAAHLKGSPEELTDCVDSDKREYLPTGITEMLSSLDSLKEATISAFLVNLMQESHILQRLSALKPVIDITSVTSTAKNCWRAWSP